MKLSSFYHGDRMGLSFELFPPKTEKGETMLFPHVEHLAQFDPSFITCTYGAGGSTRNKTLAIVEQVKNRHQIPVASHLTCVGTTVEQLRLYLAEAERLGIDAIVALRGDPPQGQTTFEAVAGGLQYANELVSLIREEFGNFGVAVAGYPEVHQEAANADLDLENLKRKVEAGADIVITQLFYQTEDFFRFRDRYQAAGSNVPLVPGILPVTSLTQIQRITSLCGARLPQSFVNLLAQRDDPEWQFNVGVEFATEQVQGLVGRQVPGLHFYVLNKSQATSAVLKNINLGKCR